VTLASSLSPLNAAVPADAAWVGSLARIGQRPQVQVAASLGIVAVAASLRLIALNRYGFNSDEAVYAGQSAALAGNHQYAQLFGVFRAHPLLVHLIVSLVYRLTGVNDVAPRLVNVAFGLGLVGMAGAVGMVARGRLVGFITMAFVAVSPYAVTVSRQMLLDGPMAFFFALTLLFLAMYVRSPQRLTLYAAAVAAGLTFLAKETAILMMPAILVFLIVARDVPVRIRDVGIGGVLYVLTILPFPLSLALAGGSRTAQQFFVWQIFRRANHTPDFYLTTVGTRIGIPLMVLAVVGVGLALRRRRGMDVLLIALTLVTVGFFEVWPVKGFQYLIPLITPVCLLAAEGLVATAAFLTRFVLPRVRRDAGPSWEVATGAVLGIVALGILVAGSITVVAAPAPLLIATDSGDELTTPAYGFVAGSGGLRASRPVGAWIEANTLQGARFVTIGPSFANVIEFYGKRQALALSVSPNPLHRNPTYDPILNPDLLIRTNAVQYLVYDSYSASRTSFFTKKLLQYIRKYHGILVYGDYEPARRSDGSIGQTPVVMIWEVHP
jgi:hypothetical protein